MGNEGAEPECHLSRKAQVLPRDPHCWGNLEQVQTLAYTDQSENRVLCPQRARGLVRLWLAHFPAMQPGALGQSAGSPWPLICLCKITQVNCNLLKAGEARSLSLRKADVQGTLLHTRWKAGCSGRSRAGTGSQRSPLWSPLSVPKQVPCPLPRGCWVASQSFLLNGCRSEKGLRARSSAESRAPLVQR